MNNGDDSRSWSGARDRCVALGGYLAFPTSSSEYDAINQYRLNTDGVGGDGHDTWGGIYQSDGVWYNVLGDRQYYFRWDNGEPSGGEYCVQFRDSEDMNDEDCHRITSVHQLSSGQVFGDSCSKQIRSLHGLPSKHDLSGWERISGVLYV